VEAASPLYGTGLRGRHGCRFFRSLRLAISKLTALLRSIQGAISPDGLELLTGPRELDDLLGNSAWVNVREIGWADTSGIVDCDQVLPIAVFDARAREARHLLGASRA
jgi:hypothetical protein